MREEDVPLIAGLPTGPRHKLILPNFSSRRENRKMKRIASVFLGSLLYFSTAHASGESCTATLSCDGKGNGKWAYNMDFCAGYFKGKLSGDPMQMCKCVPIAQRPKNVPPEPSRDPAPTTYCPQGTPPPGGMSVPHH